MEVNWITRSEKTDATIKRTAHISAVTFAQPVKGSLLNLVVGLVSTVSRNVFFPLGRSFFVRRGNFVIPWDFGLQCLGDSRDSDVWSGRLFLFGRLAYANKQKMPIAFAILCWFFFSIYIFACVFPFGCLCSVQWRCVQGSVGRGGGGD